jgi:hypothetical protein
MLLDPDDLEELDEDSVEFLTSDDPEELTLADRHLREEEPEPMWYDEYETRNTATEGDE